MEGAREKCDLVLKVGEFGKIGAVTASSRLFFNDPTPRPLGHLTLAGIQHHSRGIGARSMRVFGSYALVLLLGGAGQYRDALGARKSVVPGDCILVFPEVAHFYGPKDGHWDEIYVCFNGPMFDLWRRDALLDPARPLHHVANWQAAFGKLQSLLEAPRPASDQEHLQQLGEFTSLLAQMVALPTRETLASSWVESAKTRLRADLGEPIRLQSVARDVGMSYDTFRKNFAREAGISPSRFRDAARIEAAQALLRSGALKNATIARTLGFRDEAHLARRFREVVKSSPREWKRAQNDETRGA